MNYNADIREEITKILKLVEDNALAVPMKIRRKRQIETPTCFFYQTQLKSIQNQKDGIQLSLGKLQTSLNIFRGNIAIYEVKVKESNKSNLALNQSLWNGLRQIAITIQSSISRLQEQLMKLQEQESFLNGKIVIYCSTTTKSTTTSKMSSIFATNTTLTPTTIPTTFSTTSPNISTSTTTMKPLEQCGKFFHYNSCF